MNHWATILDSIEEGIGGNKEKCRAYADLWLEKLQKDGDTQITARVQRILEGKRGKVLRPATIEQLFEEQRLWMLQHQDADSFSYNLDQMCIQVVYVSPMQKAEWLERGYQDFLKVKKPEETLARYDVDANDEPRE